MDLLEPSIRHERQHELAGLFLPVAPGRKDLQPRVTKPTHQQSLDDAKSLNLRDLHDRLLAGQQTGPGAQGVVLLPEFVVAEAEERRNDGPHDEQADDPEHTGQENHGNDESTEPYKLRYRRLDGLGGGRDRPLECLAERGCEGHAEQRHAQCARVRQTDSQQIPTRQVDEHLAAVLQYRRRLRSGCVVTHCVDTLAQERNQVGMHRRKRTFIARRPGGVESYRHKTEHPEHEGLLGIDSLDPFETQVQFGLAKNALADANPLAVDLEAEEPIPQDRRRNDCEHPDANRQDRK